MKVSWFTLAYLSALPTSLPLSTSLPSDAVRQTYGVYCSDWYLSFFCSSRESYLAKSIWKGLALSMALWFRSRIFLIFSWQISMEGNQFPPCIIDVSLRELESKELSDPVCMHLPSVPHSPKATYLPRPRCQTHTNVHLVVSVNGALKSASVLVAKPWQRVVDRHWHHQCSWLRLKWRRNAKHRIWTIWTCWRLWI